MLKKLKATRAMLEHLVAIADDAPTNLTLKHLQAALEIQGYYAGVRYRYVPLYERNTLKFTGWRIEERQFGTSA